MGSSRVLSGTCGELIRAKDWSTSPVGPIEDWPARLTVLVQTLLRSRHPMLLFWGPELIQFYNDAFLPSFGEGKHPRAMGQPGRECWAEVWDLVGDEIEAVLSDGTPTWHADALVPIHRNGRIEEVFWTYGYSPAYDETGNVAGVLIVCTETTAGVLANRRLELLARIAHGASATRGLGDVLTNVFTCCRELSVDLPFAAALDETGNEIVPGYGLSGDGLDAIPDLLAQWDGSREAGTVLLDSPIAAGPWPEPVSTAFVAPIAGGRLVLGISPRLPFDEPYGKFVKQLLESIQATQERVEAVAAHVRTDRERRELLMQAPVAAALLVGPDLVFELANRAYVQLVGREVRGRPYREALPEVVGSPVEEAFQRAYRDGVPFSASEMPVAIDHDGSGTPQERFFNFNLEPIRDASDEVTGMMAIAVDVTDTVRARQAREQAYAERIALVERLEAASRAKDEFLAMLGHELRNPLSPIITALELIKMRGESAFEREHAIIERQARHLVRLVDDLLDVARIVGGKIELKQELCDIRDVLSKGVEIAEVLLEGRRHRLTVSVPEDIAWWGDPARLAQIVSNLLTNAARYTEPGGDVDMSAVEDGGDLLIRVKDTGMGIEPDMMPHIFDMFIQGRQKLDRGSGGLGLGLTLTRTLVELHGGSITAVSEGRGEGSTFTVRLPLVAEPAAVDPTGPTATMQRKRILVVDDNRDAAMMLQLRLEEAGHTVEVAPDGVEALELYDRFRPEVALLDLGLPVMDGYELVRRLAAADGAGSCQFIAVTGYGQQTDRERSVAAGFHAHLVKPVDFDELTEAINIGGSASQSDSPRTS